MTNPQNPDDFPHIMSALAIQADDVQKLLDNGWRIGIFRNELDYTAEAINQEGKVVTTDDFTPLKALCRLIEKATTGRIVG